MFAAKGEVDKARAAYQQGLVSGPDDSSLLANMGALAVHEKDWVAAEDYCRRSLAAGPNAFAHSSLCAVHMARKQRKEAYQRAKQAVYLRPDIHEHWMRFALAAQVNLDWEAAEAAYAKVMALFPEDSKAHAEARTCRAIIKMSLGNWKEGLREYESRLIWKHPLPSNVAPMWDGEPLAGKTVVFALEQGIGDQIMCLRWIRYLCAEGVKKIIMPCHPLINQLVPMLEDKERILAIGEIVPQYDWFIPAGSMPYVLYKTYPLIGAVSSPPYLRPPVVMRDEPRPTNLQVGLCWKGSPDHPNDLYRSMDLKNLQPILEVPGVDFHCLQCSKPEKAEALNAGMTAYNFKDRLDFQAEVTGDLDLVISVDTMSAHLAGAVGTPVWTLLPANPDFRWGMIAGDTPFYPSMRLFRQEKMGEWRFPVEEAAILLSGIVKKMKGKE
jgi:hypothetical protein